MKLSRQIPNILTISRFILSALIIFCAVYFHNPKYLFLLFILASFTDFLDGFVARKINAASIKGAVLDGYADIALYSAAVLSIYFLFPEIIKRNLPALTVLIILQAASWGFSVARFGKITSYHTYLAKIWGTLLFISLSAIFAFSNDLLLAPMLIVGSISIFEDIVITTVLPSWKSGITDFTMAIRLRTEYVKSTRGA